MVSQGRIKRQNPDLNCTTAIKVHVSCDDKKTIESHFGKGKVSRKIRELILDHIYNCSGC